MVKSKGNKVEGISRQTADMPHELMKHFDSIKRDRGYRSFTDYAVFLVQRDKESLTPQTPLVVLTDTELSGSIQPEIDMLEDVVTHARRVADTADRIRKQLLVRSRGVPTQGTGESASEKTRGKRGGKQKAS